MTDTEALFHYRLQQAEETLRDAESMLQDNYTPRSIMNRSYYVLFYSLLALFIKAGVEIKTSKHSGIISIFDKEFIHKGVLDKKYSRILHDLFELRQESDYKEFVEFNMDEASECVEKAEEFYNIIKNYIT